MEKELNYSIVYDKSMKQYAIDLQNFVSKMSGVKCMKFGHGKVPDNVNDIDKSYVLYLGEKCSKHLQYENKFEQYGIQIGWYGTKAWIRLVKEGEKSFFTWLNKGDVSFIADDEKKISRNVARYSKFCEEYYNLYKEFRISRDAAIDQSYSKSEAIEKMTKDFQFLRLKWVDILISLWGTIKDIIGEQKAYRRLNVFAVMYFCKNYLKPFLEEGKIDVLNHG